MATKTKGAGAGESVNSTDQKPEEQGRPLSIFDLARNAELRHQAERAAKLGNVAQTPEGEEQEGAERRAGKEKTEFVTTPYSLTHHPDGSPKRMVICRPNGSSEREVTVEEWDRLQANPNLAPGAWVIKYTEVVAPHHSDDY